MSESCGAENDLHPGAACERPAGHSQCHQSVTWTGARPITLLWTRYRGRP